MTAIVFLIATLSEVVEGTPYHENVFQIVWWYNFPFQLDNSVETDRGNRIPVPDPKAHKSSIRSRFDSRSISHLISVQIDRAIFRLKVWGLWATITRQDLQVSETAEDFSSFRDCVTAQLDTRMLTRWYLTLLQKQIEVCYQLGREIFSSQIKIDRHLQNMK